MWQRNPHASHTCNTIYIYIYIYIFKYIYIYIEYIYIYNVYDIIGTLYYIFRFSVKGDLLLRRPRGDLDLLACPDFLSRGDLDRCLCLGDRDLDLDLDRRLRLGDLEWRGLAGDLDLCLSRGLAAYADIVRCFLKN